MIEDGLGGAHASGRMVYAGSVWSRDKEASGCAHAVLGSLSEQAVPFPLSAIDLTLSSSVFSAARHLILLILLPADIAFEMDCISSLLQ